MRAFSPDKKTLYFYQRSPHAGAFIALGHGAVEAPLIFILLAGAGMIFAIPAVKTIIGFAGGIMLVIMALDMFRSVSSSVKPALDGNRHPFTEGIVLSAGNPYFLLWWATVGINLINGSAGLGFTGIILLILIHWLCDFIWLYALSAVSFNGGKMLGNVFRNTVFVICGIMLMLFGLKFFLDAGKTVLRF